MSCARSGRGKLTRSIGNEGDVGGRRYESEHGIQLHMKCVIDASLVPWIHMLHVMLEFHDSYSEPSIFTQSVQVQSLALLLIFFLEFVIRYSCYGDWRLFILVVKSVFVERAVENVPRHNRTSRLQELDQNYFERNKHGKPVGRLRNHKYLRLILVFVFRNLF